MKIAADLHPKAPCNQPFDKKNAIERAHHHGGPNLERRMTDYQKMIDDPKFKSTGFHKPGSNKK